MPLTLPEPDDREPELSESVEFEYQKYKLEKLFTIDVPEHDNEAC